MKREPELEPLPVYSIFPVFFWRFCCGCKKEFRREKGWSIYERVPTEMHSPRIDSYVCHGCAATKEEAFNIATEAEKLSRPPLEEKPTPGKE